MLKTKSQTVYSLRRLTSKIEAQFDHYTVEHDQVPPQELAEQHALAQRVISDIEEDHSGLSVRTEGWYRVVVVGSSPEEAKEKVSMLQEMYAPAHPPGTGARPVPAATRIHPPVSRSPTSRTAAG